MRASVVKNINNLIPDDVIPPAILNNDNINKKRLKKRMWLALNCIQREKVSKNFREGK